jgi:hypothetical protein
LSTATPKLNSLAVSGKSWLRSDVRQLILTAVAVALPTRLQAAVAVAAAAAASRRTYRYPVTFITAISSASAVAARPLVRWSAGCRLCQKRYGKRRRHIVWHDARHTTGSSRRLREGYRRPREATGGYGRQQEATDDTAYREKQIQSGRLLISLLVNAGVKTSRKRSVSLPTFASASASIIL